MNNKHTFKLCALFALIAFSSANSYSMLRRTQSQISALPFVALRHYSATTPKQQETAQANEDEFSKIKLHPEDMEKLKRYIHLNRMHPADMEELKEHITRSLPSKKYIETLVVCATVWLLFDAIYKYNESVISLNNAQISLNNAKTVLNNINLTDINMELSRLRHDEVMTKLNRTENKCDKKIHDTSK